MVLMRVLVQWNKSYQRCVNTGTGSSSDHSKHPPTIEALHSAWATSKVTEPLCSHCKERTDRYSSETIKEETVDHRKIGESGFGIMKGRQAHETVFHQRLITAFSNIQYDLLLMCVIERFMTLYWLPGPTTP